MDKITLSQLKSMLVEVEPKAIRQKYGDRLGQDGLDYLSQVEALEQDVYQVSDREEVLAAQPRTRRRRGWLGPLLVLMALALSIVAFLWLVPKSMEPDASPKLNWADLQKSQAGPTSTNKPTVDPAQESIEALREELERARLERERLAVELNRVVQKKESGQSAKSEAAADEEILQLRQALHQAGQLQKKQAKVLENATREQEKIAQELSQVEEMRRQQVEFLEQTKRELAAQSENLKAAEEERQRLTKLLAEAEQERRELQTKFRQNQDRAGLEKRSFLEQKLSEVPEADPSGITNTTFRERPKLDQTDLSGADLNGLDFKEAFLRNTDFRESSLHRAQLNNTVLTGATLINANLEGASLERANLKDANVHGAILRRANLKYALLKGLKNWKFISSLEGANIHGVKNAPSGFRDWALAQGAVEKP